MSDAQVAVVNELIEKWRSRLYEIGWFMRGVNETIARMANEEENQKGRFWEGRYKSQALLDEAAVLTCMAYVDLNPIRANMTDDLVKSDFTSIQQRLFDHAKRKQHHERRCQVCKIARSFLMTASRSRNGGGAAVQESGDFA